MVSPREVLDEASIERLELDMALCDQHAALIEANRHAIADKALDLFDEEGLSADDVDEALYDGFVEGADTGRCREVHDARSPDAWRTMERQFEDDRLGELLFRMRARNHPEYLVASERARWQKYCQQRQSGAEAALARIAELRQEEGVEAAVLDSCEAAICRRVAAVSGA